MVWIGGGRLDGRSGPADAAILAWHWLPVGALSSTFALLTPAEHLLTPAEQSSETTRGFPALLSGGERVLSEGEQSKVAEVHTH